MFPKLEWYQAITKRVSRRRFRPEGLPQETLAKLELLCYQFRFPEARAVLVLDNSGAIYKGLVGSYGKIKGAGAYIAFVGDIGFPHYQEKVGYLGEGIILEATNLGLGTCWVGGFFRPEVVAKQIYLDPGEKVLAITPLGLTDEQYSLEEKLLMGFAKSRKRKELAELTAGIPSEQWPHWVSQALEAARLAPSAVNRQPWRFMVEQDSITVKLDSPKDSYNIAKRLDCGIAMLHLELGAMAAGVRGQWQYLAGEEVAVFRVEKQ